jgi:sterol desaturase/sphingolipid hydroxylase (fatty acid hydroxylase superfamily)
MIGIPVGLLYANAFEWAFHKYVLHGLGKNPRSMWAFHFHEHHREARLHAMVDPGYQKSVWHWNAQGKEAAALVVGGVLLLPLFPVAPYFTATVLACAANYYRVHKKAHVDPAWAREHLPWHYAHHMGRDPNKNWCVTYPLFDRLMGTVEPLSPRPQTSQAAADPATAPA